MAIAPVKKDPKDDDRPVKALASPSENPIVNLIDGGREKTVNQTAVDPDSQRNPWNTDDVYQKTGDYSTYEEMLKDDQVSVALSIKKDLVIGSGWHIACEEDDQDDVKADLEKALGEDLKASFDDCLVEMLAAYEFGFSVTEKQFTTRDDGTLTLQNLKTRHPVSWLFHQDIYGNVTRYEQQGATAEFARVDPNSIIHYVNNPRYGRPYGTSDLRAAYNAWFIKRQIVKFYAIYLEKMASPLPVGRYDRMLAKDEDIQRLHNTLKKLQTSSALTIPTDLEVEFLETTGNGEAYIKGVNLFNMFIGRALMVPDLLGFQGAETTGGAQALGREQMKIYFLHIMRRRRTIENIVNEHLIKPLVIWNHGLLENYPKFKLNPIEEEKAEANARLWLEAVKGKAVKPTLEEVNTFKRIICFPETTEEEWEEQQQDAIEEAAQAAKIAEAAGGEEEDGKDGKKPPPKDGEKDGFAFALPAGDYHKKTDFRAIGRRLDSDLDVFVATAAPVVRSLVAGLAKRLAKWNTAKAAKLEQLEKIALPKAGLRQLERLLDASLVGAFDRAREMAHAEIFKHDFKVQAAPEFLATLEEEDYNFIKDWEYQLTKRVRSDIIAAVKDGTPISSVIDVLTSEGSSEAFVAVERYARTKFTEVMNKGRVAYFESTGVVGAYQYSAILDGVTSKICQGLHGKVFKAGTQPVPPMHFNCRSVLVPITNFEAWKPDTRAGGKPIDEFIEDEKGKGFARS